MKATLAIFLLLLSVIAVGQQKDKQPRYSPPGKMVDLGGYRLHLNCTGKSGPTVVLIAGAGDFSFDWGLVQPGVSRFTRACSYDRAGLAWSEPGPTPRTMRQDAYELHRLLEAAHIKAPYVLIGHSLGGLIARVYEEQYPDEVAGILSLARYFSTSIDPRQGFTNSNSHSFSGCNWDRLFGNGNSTCANYRL